MMQWGGGGWSSNNDKDLKVIEVAIGATGNKRKSITTILFPCDISPIHSAKWLQKLVSLKQQPH